VSDIEVLNFVQATVVRDARIVRAAVRFGDKVYVGWRHSDIIQHVHALGKGYTTQDDQGFVTQYGYFYDREQSARIALRAKQIKTLPGVLISEDLWAKDGTPTNGEPYCPTSTRCSG